MVLEWHAKPAQLKQPIGKCPWCDKTWMRSFQLANANLFVLFVSWPSVIIKMLFYNTYGTSNYFIIYFIFLLSLAMKHCNCKSLLSSSGLFLFALFSFSWESLIIINYVTCKIRVDWMFEKFSRGLYYLSHSFQVSHTLYLLWNISQSLRTFLLMKVQSALVPLFQF